MRHILTMPELSDQVPEQLLDQLLDLIDRLRRDTEAFVDEPGDQQRWYDRGYANGMVRALQRLGQGERLGDRVPDDVAALCAHLAMPWGKAYRHGETMGDRETHEITGIPST